MYLAEVKGNVVATTKNEKLIGSKLLIVQPINPAFENNGQPLIAVDTVGAGFGDRVIIASGGSARTVFQDKTPIDAAIVAIIDSLEIY
ncbi:EutN/CcmL family microcompartment protein [Irregularibacter muris]|uniref:EutN/CcmL family microcompartment protein n=1 Tax=Irregularibacter muris TaxID=1796619 RepID=A0AAE3HDB1_9FIRM|nr:EutN/CcmL family microcompartment protein [Irregularibacter muris]MCR1898390.1 EutN/CcmL family microcompartment protein [Irregularibacter muris]